MSDRQPLYGRLRQHLHDAHREAGWGFGYSYPAGTRGWLPLWPLVRIDYVFHDGAWAAPAAWTKVVAGSDHRAVVADLVLR